MEWKRIITKEDKPEYFHGVIIFAKGEVCYDWHRLSNGDSEYYGSLDTDRIIPSSEVTHWMELLQPPK